MKQTSVTLEQNNIIANLNQQMQILDDSLKTAFKNIGRLQSNIQTQKRTDSSYSSNPPLFDQTNKGADVELRLLEFLAKNPIPLKFIPRGNDVYTFGSRKVKIELVRDKLTVRINGGNINIEEFIRLYAHQELLKMKIVNLGTHFIDMSEEDLPLDTKDDQVIWDNAKEQYSSYKGAPKRAKTSESAQYNSNVSRSNKPDKREVSPRALTGQDEPNPNDFMIFDISPQGTRELSGQNKARVNLRSPYNDKKPDPTKAFANSLRNYEPEPRQKNSARSHDPYKGSSSNTATYKK